MDLDAEALVRVLLTRLSTTQVVTHQEYLEWADQSEELMMLRSVLRLEPEASPCELSVVLRKPCDRVMLIHYLAYHRYSL